MTAAIVKEHAPSPELVKQLEKVKALKEEREKLLALLRENTELLETTTSEVANAAEYSHVPFEGGFAVISTFWFSLDPADRITFMAE